MNALYIYRSTLLRSKLVLPALTRRCSGTPHRQHASGLKGLEQASQRRGNTHFELPTTPARTRFAPSPTGYLHLGSLRTALYNYLLAKATGGQFLIRIEDTDRRRLVPDAESRLFDDLRWANLEWDEGPDVGGAFGPYRQSERLHHYTKYAQQLLASGHAFRCFCAAEDIEKAKREALDSGKPPVYPGTCRDISAEESEERAARGDHHVVRWKGSGENVPFVERVFPGFKGGSRDSLSDYVLMKSDGYPTYHFANVVDDHLMEITHVIRASEWLISTPKHAALYKALGWTPPEYCHVGLLVDPHGQKLSKRNHDIDITAYRENSTLPLALNNWLMLLGWGLDMGHSSRNDMKISPNELFFDLESMAKNFSFKFTRGNIKINPEKLSRFQARHTTHLLETTPFDEPTFTKTFTEPLYTQIHSLEQDRLTRLPADAVKQTALIPRLTTPEAIKSYILEIFRHTPAANFPNNKTITEASHFSLFWRIPKQTYTQSLQKRGTLPPEAHATEQSILTDTLHSFESIPEEKWTVPALKEAVDSIFATKDHRNNPGPFFDVLRFAQTGYFSLPSKQPSIAFFHLGKTESLARLGVAAEVYGEIGPGKEGVLVEDDGAAMWKPSNVR